MTAPVTLLICALGGEGGGLLSEWVVDAAQRAGLAVQSTSVPGVAQRTGATTYYVEIFPLPLVQVQGRHPVFSLYPVPGALDLLVSSELLETARPKPPQAPVITRLSRVRTIRKKLQNSRILAIIGDNLEIDYLVSRFLVRSHGFA